MAFVHSFEFTPPPRYDAVPWSAVRVEVRDGDTWDEVETIDLEGSQVDPAGLDSDPTAPNARRITTQEAPAATGYFRVVWLDSDLDESPPSSSVLSPGELTAYLTLEELKATLSLTDTDTFADPDLVLALNAASRMIDGDCRRRFYRDTEASERVYLSGDDQVAIDDLVQLDLVEFDTASGLEFAEYSGGSLDYRVGPPNAAADGRPYEWLDAWTGYFPRGRVRVTGIWGWPEVPAAVKEATGILAARLLKRAREAPLGLASVGAEGISNRISRTDPDLAALVAQYRKDRSGSVSIR